MAEQGLAGAHRGKKKRTTIADPQALRAQDLVNRKFDPAAPNQLWVADFNRRPSLQALAGYPVRRHAQPQEGALTLSGGSR